MYTYTDITDEAEWKAIVEKGAAAAPFTARETNEQVEFITYDNWDPSLYGACEMLRFVRPDDSHTSTGYIRCGSSLEMRVTRIPENPDKSASQKTTDNLAGKFGDGLEGKFGDGLEGKFGDGLEGKFGDGLGRKFGE